jgi:hypothetical protein
VPKSAADPGVQTARIYEPEHPLRLSSMANMRIAVVLIALAVS